MSLTNHPLTETAAAELWSTASGLPWICLPAVHRPGTVVALRAAFDAGREHEREHADPHHDPRPWQDCPREDIHEGDRVESPRGDILRIGVAHHQDEDGDWCTEDGWLLTDGDCWPLRRIPAPTPPDEEVELPDEHPAHITDVEGLAGDVCAHMAQDRHGVWIGVDQDGDRRGWRPRSIDAFTLPDGTRARRDGEHADGTPRFVKEADQ